jgi:hypothetical protein
VEAGQHAPHLHTLAVTTADAKSWGCAPHPIPAYAGTEADVASAHDAPDGAPPRMKEPLSAIGYRSIGYFQRSPVAVASVHDGFGQNDYNASHRCNPHTLILPT